MKAVELKSREYVVQSKKSGELAIGRPIVFSSRTPTGFVSIGFFPTIDGWLIEAPQAMAMPFFLNPKGFRRFMVILGEL